MNSRPILSSIHPIEAKAGECYTRKVFEIFKKEWIEATSNLMHETLSKRTEEIKYRVGQLDVDKKYWRIVSFCLLNKMHVTCSCAKYETCGILCKHSLYVMKKKHVDTLPSHYILPRWTLNARYKVGKRSIRLGEMNNENGVSAYTLWCVRSNFNKLIEQAKDSPSEIENVNNILIKLLQYQAIRKKPIPDENVSQGSCVRISQVDMMPQLSVRDPLGPTNTKGRPKISIRINSSLEVPKKRTCSYCQGLGHYATSCSKRKVDEALQEKK
ncbi:protein FAR1-RELATED SEQUENCE 9-like [Lactuca sativa]|uniref:protein FAR1-RELATED SEQUENCE 9-like n=1 Tax=Lactuca sativa TaxID=4236 RepID=UPI000CD97BF2|nr:protein FAR1-RELATED SEQUENCE 9-like [Lactuca sativa]